jgi:hypothetical protein
METVNVYKLLVATAVALTCNSELHEQENCVYAACLRSNEDKYTRNYK